MIEANYHTPRVDHTRTERVAAFYRGWDKLEKSLGEGVPVIDSDLTGVDKVHVRRFDDRAQALWVLQREVKPLARFREELVDPLDQRITLAAELDAAETVLHSLQHPVEFGHYLKGTTGVDLRYFNDGEIDEATRVLKESLGCVGYRSSLVRESFTDYRNEHPLDPESVQQGMVRVVERDLPKMVEYLGLENLDPRFEDPASLMVFRSEPDSGYRMEAYHRDGSPTLKVNTAKPFFEGDEQYFAHHEFLNHIVDIGLLASGIADGLIIPDLGITTVYGRRAYKDEGLAQNLPRFMPEVLLVPDKFGKLAYDWRKVRELVFNNAHIMGSRPDYRVEGGISNSAENEAIDYSKGHLLGIMDEDEIVSEVRSRLGQQIWRTNYYVYGVGAADFEEFAKRLGSDDKRKRFLAHTLGVPLTPDQVRNLVDSLAEAA